ncbi:hypothetical protein [Bradyrhizobium zhanjiangense]|uniref:Uncharacterized protein n=1 Tax=Bradyrhizobium zhanjiangense TaxID=1325107 RepID=A0A4Q0SRQ3_9BRAD|nr:hypothetical protein [Bradyrhizobium zhanjiangense]RXH41079.1 hypothetical protein XH94_09560 [Bradyrhizobium zhanjiangense]
MQTNDKRGGSRPQGFEYQEQPLNSPDSIKLTVSLLAPNRQHVGSDFLESSISIADAERYRRDPDAFAAEHFGLTKEQYREWVVVEGYPLCGTAPTESGLCPERVGGCGCGPDEWKRLHRNRLCSIHSGLTAPKNGSPHHG